MPLKKTINQVAPAATPSKSSRQRTLTNKQQQIRKIVVSSFLDAMLIFFTLLVAQKNEKEEAAKQRAINDAIRAEQRQEELNGFHKNNLPGNLFLLNTIYVSINLLLKYSRQTTMLSSWGQSRKTMMMNP